MGSDDHHRSEKDAVSSEKNLPHRQETCCSALSVAGSRGCCERSLGPSEVLRKGRQDWVVVGERLTRAGGYDTLCGSERECDAEKDEK